MQILELSYNGLEEEYKQIFLDVACILKGWDKEDAIRVLESRGFHAEVGLRVLEQKSLITISKQKYFTEWGIDEYKELGMHDHLQEMGRNIVRRSHPDEPQRHSRLSVKKEIEDILTNDLGTQATKCLCFRSPGFSSEIAVKGLAKMKDLRFIHIDLEDDYFEYIDLEDDYFESNIVQFDKVYLPSSLRFMRWWGFPFSSLPNTFLGENLVELNIGHSSIVQLWENGEEKVLHKLRFLTISFSKLRTFDLRLAPNLEQLTIYSCTDFVELHMPVESVKLEYLDLSHLKLKSLRLRNTPSLKKLILKFHNDLVELQMPAEILKLEHLVLDDSKLTNLHLGNTPNLEKLKLVECNDLVELQMPVESPKLEYLDLTASKLTNLHLGNTPNLVGLDISRSKIVQLWKNGEEKVLPKLKFLTIKRSKLQTFDLRFAPNLEQLTISECYDFVELTFSSTEIKNLPDSICMLKHLKSLKLESCLLLEKLPDDLGRLESLETLILTDCRLLQYIPNSIFKMKCINNLRLSGCIRVVELPEDIGCLECLKELNIEGTGISHLPQSIFKLRGLRIVGSMRLIDTYGLLLKRRRTCDDDDDDEIVCYI